ncbi:MAG: hypothetical protein AAF404_02640 [Pseudomonadota bacterium]
MRELIQQSGLRICVFIAAMMLCVTPPTLATDDRLVVVTHPDNRDDITRKDLYRLYFGKHTSMPGGAQLIPILNDGDEEQLRHFSSTMLQRSSQQLRSYWARQLFTGKGNPPVRVKSAVDVKKMIADNPQFIGYLWESELDSSLRVVLPAPN